ncbi:MAG: hypothetical protein COB46_09330 [Rhodospirillaceae bacterium]|nr:MAG: hypothetical protein COB46_09330 [Rhodospirillaceae bacterium]
MQSWLILIAAIVLEVAGTTAMKLSDGFTRLLPSVLLVVFYLLSITALTLALKRIDVSIAYAIWAGVGTVLVAVVGVLWFRESVSLLKVGSILLIAAGVAGLHLSSIAGEH